MAFEIPTSLIHEVQIALRKEAGLSSYDPDDPSLPDLPSLDEAISGLDPSPPYLRCKHCRGSLLRGLQSMFCIYCGSEQIKEFPPDPISFKASSGFRWLLESLDLDGSEAVGLATEKGDSTKSQSASKDELLLSDLLDLEFKWTAESEKSESGVTSKEPNQGKSYMNLAGIDLDNFFPEANKVTVPSAYEEQLIPDKQIKTMEKHAFPGQESLSLFENAQSSDTALRSTEGEKNGVMFSGWEAEFQSASSGIFHGDSKSFDPFLGSTVSLSSHLGADVSPDKDVKYNDGKPENDSVPLASMSEKDDFWNTSITGVSDKTEGFEMSIKANDDGPKDNSNNPLTMIGDWIQDDIWQTSSTKASNSEVINENDDSFDAWQDFTSSGNTQDPSQISYKHTGVEAAPSDDDQASQMNSMNLTNNLQDMEFGSIFQPDLFSGASGHQNISTVVNDKQLEASVSDRVADVKIKTEGDAEQAANRDDGFSTTVHSETEDLNVEMLMSEMHDLSFMLESNLSIPQKVDEAVL